ncbi:hypothetical protein B1J93_03360 [Leptospira kirschneri serovar Pomona]|uniref:Uncharacterized protein n=1 Tax=Leptospira kirschneri serovar Pomona TaxID=561005 RepID=A0A1T1E0Q0_9LEPT|nr:hypothetical protein B1J93_03360 [Leptospira kirschneri serovar Pomona]
MYLQKVYSASPNCILLYQKIKLQGSCPASVFLTEKIGAWTDSYENEFFCCHTLRIVESMNEIPEHFSKQEFDRNESMTVNALGINSTKRL